VTELSTISEIAVAYALLTVGQNPDESKIMRLRCADAARELNHPLTAIEIEESIAGRGTSLVEAIEAYSVRT
jgi:hypothetical protein